MAISFALLIISSATVLAAPLPQGAGVGAGCDAILFDADTGSGGSGAASPPPPPPTPPKGTKVLRRQLNKVGDWTAAITSLASPKIAATQVGISNSVDDTGTNDSAQVGQAIGALEVEAGTSIGNFVPSKLAAGKRQLDKVGAGTAAIISLTDPEAASYQEGLTNNTSDSTVIGQQLGALEVEAGSGAGNLVPSKVPSASTKLPAGLV